MIVDVTLSIPLTTIIGEGDGMVRVCATLSAVEATERNLTVTLTTSSGTGKQDNLCSFVTSATFTATATDDYIHTSNDITFNSGSAAASTGCTNISIIDDNALESNQTFTVTLTTSDPDVILGSNVTTITIVDNDGTIIPHHSVHNVEYLLQM